MGGAHAAVGGAPRPPPPRRMVMHALSFYMGGGNGSATKSKQGSESTSVRAGTWREREQRVQRHSEGAQPSNSEASPTKRGLAVAPLQALSCW